MQLIYIVRLIKFCFFSKTHAGRKIAIDASMCLYQFLIAVRAEGAQLTSIDGETTSHLMGIFYRSIRLLENGIKPVYVFDGKPPEMKSGELAKRQEKREEAQKQLEKATEAGDADDMEKFNRRLVRVTKQHNAEAKELLKLMGIPYIDAPCEAEAQCAAMAKAGKVYATATEDMDALTFGTSILLRHLTFSEARKMPVQEFHYEKILAELEFTKEQVCILGTLECMYYEYKRLISNIFSSSICASCLVAITANRFVVSDQNVQLNWFSNSNVSKKFSKTSTKANTLCRKTGIMNKLDNCSSILKLLIQKPLRYVYI